MKRVSVVVFIFLMACLGAAFALDGNEDQSILEGLRTDPDQFSTLLSLIDSAGLTQRLQDAGPVTLLAPTNQAFEALDAPTLATLQADPDRLAAVLNGHILPGAFTMLDLKDAAEGSLVPLSDEPYEVEITADGLEVNGVGFVATDVDNMFSNGVVQVANGVLLPASMRQESEDAADADAPAVVTPPAVTTPPDNEGPGATTPVTPPADTTPPDTTPPGDDEGPGATTPVPAPPLGQPETPAETPEPTTAFVRLAQLSPSATTLDLVLAPQEEGATVAEGDDFSGVPYGSATAYKTVQPGTYLVNATMTGQEDALFDGKSVTFDAGNYYTLAVSGLEIPAEDAEAADAEGLAGWVQGLFGAGETDRDVLAINVTVYEDEVRQDAENRRVRVVNAAPGSPAFDVVAIDSASEPSVLVADLTYTEVSDFTDLGDDVAALQVNIADSAVVALELANGVNQLGNDSTIFIIGTTFEGAPYDAIILQNGEGAEPVTTGANR